MKISLCVLAILGWTACGDDPLPPPGGGGPGVDGSVDPDGSTPLPPDATPPDATPNPDAPPPDPEGPSVRVLQPTDPMGDFSLGAIVTETRFTVVCEATPNPATGSLVDSSSVRITTFVAGQIVEQVSAQPAVTPDQYEASVSVIGQPNGSLGVRCTASDTASEPRTNADQLDTFLDLGPEIAITSPVMGEGYSGAVDLIFTVEGKAVAAEDPFEAPRLNEVEAVISGAQIPLGSASPFAVNVRFDDTDLFNPPPPPEADLQLVIRASNERGVTREEQIQFRKDDLGPEIDVTDPAPGAIVGGILTVTATITDPVGVDPASVVATIVSGDNAFPLTNVSGDTYVGSVDTTSLNDPTAGFEVVFANIIVRAEDTIGNQSSVGFLVTLDNHAPQLSLDPQRMREGRINADSDIECSILFDPLGSDAVNDLEAVPQLSKIRAWVEDIGNSAQNTGGILIPKAGVVQSTVQLFVLDDESGALLVDRNDDNVCDDINPLLLPTSIPGASNEVAVIDLTPLTPTGTAFFAPPDESATDPGYIHGSDSGCVEPPPGTDPPPPLCFQVEIPGADPPVSRIVGDGQSPNVPVIYGIPPVSPLQCFGTAFDQLGTNITNGWACLALRAEDERGNIGVSPPMRVCFGDPSNCPSPAPDCSGTYDQTNDTVDPFDDCVTSQPFPEGQVRIPL